MPKALAVAVKETKEQRNIGIGKRKISQIFDLR